MSKPETSYLIGVDGGGTGCRAAIGTQGDGILARAQGGRANATTDITLALENVRSVVRAAADSAGIAWQDLRTATAHIGLAGVVTDKIAQTIATALPFAKCTVTDDSPTAIAGALNGADGFVAAIGTGSFIGTSQQGDFRTVGGYGFQVSDQASGAWLGRAALVQALECHDGLMPHSNLTSTLMARFDDLPAKLISFVQTARPADYGTFAPDVLNAAIERDAHSVHLLNEGAAYIARGLTALGFGPGNPLCLMGGLGPHYQAFLPAGFTQNLVTAKASAVDGAFHLARVTKD